MHRPSKVSSHFTFFSGLFFVCLMYVYEYDNSQLLETITMRCYTKYFLGGWSTAIILLILSGHFQLKEVDLI